ncbi:MAG: winged helix DNA-binding protein [Bacteroidales bacterium]|nr:winged helix DNA-binding protein [Bacteroidales bacterium]
MSKYSLLFQILNHLEEFENNSGKKSIEEFALYLKDKVLASKSSFKEENFDFSKKENHDYKKFEEVEFSTLLTNLYRFAKHYLKKAFKNRAFKSVDEFSFLASLIKEESLLKSELINRHLLEISTGSEVLRRLIKDKLIYEYKDPDDGRAKRVALTKDGYAEITKAFAEMYKVAHIVKGNLNDDEMHQAILIFKKLSFFHWDIHDEDKDSDLDDIYNKYVKNND